jgi:hypothetical protein
MPMPMAHVFVDAQRAQPISVSMFDHLVKIESSDNQ